MPRANPKLVKIHRSYSVDEISDLFGLHKNTVRGWLKAGLPPIDGHRPTLVHGAELAQFLRKRRSASKQPLKPGEIYCIRCRAPRQPAGAMADYIPMTGTRGNLRGICPVCERLIHRAASLAKLDRVRGDLDVNFPPAAERLVERAGPSGNCDFHDQRWRA